MKRKIISFILVLTMAIGFMPTLKVEANAPKITKDKAGLYLKQWGILVGRENGDLDLNGRLTRVDTTVLLSKLFNEAKLAQNYNTNNIKKFKDLEYNWYKPYIAWACGNKHMIGTETYKFGPGKQLLAGDFSLIMLRTLGYAGEDKMGLNSKQAFNKAKDMGILNGVKASKFMTPLDRGDMAIIVYNSLYQKMDSGKGVLFADYLKINLNEPLKEKPIKDKPKNNYNSEFEQEVFRLVNIERKKRGINPLKFDYDMKKASNTRAVEIVSYWSHTRPNGELCFSLHPRMMGENIASGQRTPKEVMKSWMNSDGHRRNILNSEFKGISISAYRDKTGKYNWVQNFSRNLK